MTDIRFLGHACFELSDGSARLLVDPFLKPNNPSAPVSGDEVDPTHILISHGHADHIADAVGVAKRTGAHCVAIVEIASWLNAQGLDAVTDPNLGGTVEFDWGWVKLVQAFHTNTLPGSEESPFSPETGTVIGLPAGLVINVGGKTIYHLGDTCLFGDLQLIAERTPVDVALIPIGGYSAYDHHPNHVNPEEAVQVFEDVHARLMVPMHFGTFDLNREPFREPPDRLLREALKRGLEEHVALLSPGQTIDW